MGRERHKAYRKLGRRCENSIQKPVEGDKKAGNAIRIKKKRRNATIPLIKHKKGHNQGHKSVG